MIAYFDFYATSIRMAIATQIQYRWATISGCWAWWPSRSSIWWCSSHHPNSKTFGNGGRIHGQGSSRPIHFWTLVRNMNIVFDPVWMGTQD